MSNYRMSVDFFGKAVMAETEGNMICLNDMLNAAISFRLNQGKAPLQLTAFFNSKGLAEYIEASAKEWNLPKESFIKKVGKGKYTRTYVHVSIAVYAAQQISPEFHAHVNRVFIEGKLLEFRERGGTEFRNLNANIDQYLPDRLGKDNKGVFIQIAKLLRSKILGDEAKTGDWDKATVSQIHLRYEYENKLCEILRLGLVKDYEHLKNLVEIIN